MSTHPLYPAMFAQLTDYERKLAQALSAYQPDWWQKAVHQQTMMDYLNAPDDARRVSAMVTMARDAVNQAHVAFGAISTVENLS